MILGMIVGVVIGIVVGIMIRQDLIKEMEDV
jgi:predicted small secreted protein